MSLTFSSTQCSLVECTAPSCHPSATQLEPVGVAERCHWEARLVWCTLIPSVGGLGLMLHRRFRRGFRRRFRQRHQNQAHWVQVEDSRTLSQSSYCLLTVKDGFVGVCSG